MCSSDLTMDIPDKYIEEVETVFANLKPKGALLYAGPQGRELLDRIDTGQTKLKVVGTRLEKLSEKAKGRQRKKTI